MLLTALHLPMTKPTPDLLRINDRVRARDLLNGEARVQVNANC